MPVWMASPFQSTLSVRRATQEAIEQADMLFISIHALRKESDRTRPLATCRTSAFQSTLSVRRATEVGGHLDGCDAISIHALRKESDR